MAGQVLKGGVMGLTINAQELQCELESSLSIAINTTETDPCKPLSTEAYKSAQWADPQVDTKAWTITGSAKAFVDTAAFNQLDLLDLLINGDPIVEVTWGTKEHPDYDYDQLAVFTGTGILALDSWDAPSVGESTYNFTITGKGKPAFTHVDVAP